MSHWLPLLVISWSGWHPTGYAYGWDEQIAGRWITNIETVYIFPKYRGQSRRIMQELLRRTFRACRRRGIRQFITRIDERRPGVLKVGMRWANYIPYKKEDGFIWCYVDIPDCSD